MLEIKFFHEVTPTPPEDGVFYGIGLAKLPGHSEWRFCEINISGSEVTETTIAAYPPDELGFRTMVSDLNSHGYRGVFAHSSLMAQLTYFAERFNHFAGNPDHLSEPAQIPDALLDIIGHGRDQEKLH